MSYLEVALEHPANVASIEYIQTHAVREGFNYPQQFFDHVTSLWADAGVRACFERAHEYQLIDSAK